MIWSLECIIYLKRNMMKWKIEALFSTLGDTPLLFHSHYLSVFQISVHPQMIKGLKRALLFRQLHICLRS